MNPSIVTVGLGEVAGVIYGALTALLGEPVSTLELYSHEQHLSYESSDYNFPGPSTFPAAPPAKHLPCESSDYYFPGPFTAPTSPAAAPATTDGHGVCKFPVTRSESSAPCVGTSGSKKRKRQDPDDSQSYVKKPPNAFMIFRREQRPSVVNELKITDSAAVNKVLGQRWKMLSKEDQAKYYEGAAAARRLHALQNPGWSASSNYGKKRKRDRLPAARE